MKPPLHVGRLCTSAGLAALLAACSPAAPAPLGEALVVVDTDAPVSRFDMRLRLDVYGLDGTWIDSQDIARRNSGDWPASFSLYVPDEGAATTMLVRLRLYPEGGVRDYRGERYAARPTSGNPGDLVATPPATNSPRLVVNGVDVTPPVEPDPGVTVDRLLMIPVTPGTRASVRPVLRGACFGTMADLANQASCVDTEAALVPLAAEALDSDMSLPPSSTLIETFGASTPCTVSPRAATTDSGGAPLYDDEVCVPGGVFILGSPQAVGGGNNQLRFYDPLPLRVALIPPMLFDHYEVTVGRYRQALANGFKPVDVSPFANGGPLATSSGNQAAEATWSAQTSGREDYPVNIVSWAEARAFCQSLGADLPTEAEWEYAAVAAGRDQQTLYTWGEAAPSCTLAVYGRWDTDTSGGVECTHATPPYPFGVARESDASMDATPAIGVVGLGGNVSEWMQDSYRDYASVCWQSQPLEDPRCWEDQAAIRSVRGGAYSDQATELLAAARPGAMVTGAGLAAGYPEIGFRCARPGAGP